MTTTTIKDPVDVLAERLAGKPGDVERASRILADIQAQVHRVLFVSPRVKGVDIHIPTPDSYHHAEMKISFRVVGGPIFKRYLLHFRLDGRATKKVWLNGKTVDTDAAAIIAARFIADAVNQTN
jgi:hypothetical protein